MSVIVPLVEQHAEEVAFNWLLRDGAVSEPHYDLSDLVHLDDRIEANLDGLRIAGNDGWEICHASMAVAEPGEIFTAGVIAFEAGNAGWMDEMLAAVELDAELGRALVSALGWLEPDAVAGPAEKLMGSSMAFLSHIGLSTLCIHRRDPGPSLSKCLTADDPRIRARALKAVGEFGRSDLIGSLASHYSETDAKCLFYAARSAALLGDTSSIGILRQIAESGSPYAQPACDLAVRLMTLVDARNWLTSLLRSPNLRQLAISGYGAVGDPVAIPVLMEHMAVPELARRAGEAFSMITGVDLAYEDLDIDAPEDFDAGPTEDPEDENVDLDPDEDLPWPDPVLIADWWQNRRTSFRNGARYLAGNTISEGTCRQVLLNGFQRQRMAAALELALAQPGQVLFEVRAPGFRQKRSLTTSG